jgi:hypothetical protein
MAETLPIKACTFGPKALLSVNFDKQIEFQQSGVGGKWSVRDLKNAFRTLWRTPAVLWFHVFIRVLKKPHKWWKPLLCALSFLSPHLKVGILRIAELPLLTYPQPFKEPFLSQFDIVHERDDVLARTGANRLDQGLVMDHGFAFNTKAITSLVQQVHELLRMDMIRYRQS